MSLKVKISNKENLKGKVSYLADKEKAERKRIVPNNTSVELRKVKE